MFSEVHRLSSYVKDKKPFLIEADWAFAFVGSAKWHRHSAKALILYMLLAELGGLAIHCRLIHQHRTGNAISQMPSARGFSACADVF